MKKLLQNRKALRWLCIALVLILISGLGASLAESGGGSVTIRDYTMSWAEMAAQIRENAAANGKDVQVTFDGSNGSKDLSASGLQLSFKLLIPDNATPETPAPAVVTTHGFYNNKEMQDSFYVELARRGFVVISLDSPGHGSTDPNYAANADIMAAVENTGAEACVEWLASQSYVDETAIGLTGHSMGSIGNSYALINLANAGHVDYVKSYLAQGQANALAMIPGFPDSLPEGLALGVIAARYDEFGMIRDDTYNYPTSTNCHDIIRASYPAFSAAEAEMETWYTAEGPVTVDYKNGERLDVNASIAYWGFYTHPIVHFSSESAGFACDFFYATLGVPTGAKFIDPARSGLWFVKEVFNLIGLIGFFLLILPLADLLLKVPVFSRLIRKDSDAMVLADATLPSYKPVWQKVWFWASGIVIAIVSAFMLEPLYIDPRYGNYLFPETTLFPQETTNTIAMWVLFCALNTIVVLLVFWALRALTLRSRENTGNPFLPAQLSGIGEFLRAMLFGFTIVGLLYVVVWAQYLVWGTDFRFWTMAVLKFPLEKIPVMLRYLPFFLFFYVINSMTNAGNRFRDLPDWLSLVFTCLFNVGGYILVWILQYSSMVGTGDYSYILVSDHSHAMFGSLAPLLMIPIFFSLIIANIIARKLYRKTGNIYVPAAINGILNTVLIVANTFTQLAYTIA